jgi:hypothetical protein
LHQGARKDAIQSRKPSTGVGQNIDTAIYPRPALCDTRIDALAPNHFYYCFIPEELDRNSPEASIFKLIK